MTISKKIETILIKSSWIRKMFEEGARLKEEHGRENVFDFSLGNPNLNPPPKFDEVLKELVNNSDSLEHRYMPNTGYPHVREAVAEYLAGEQEVPVTGQDVIMTCGAGGALNVILKAILDPGDEVITPAPYFVEYKFYSDNHGGTLITAPTKADFSLDIDAIAAAITEKTKAVLINSPNNPTGQVYKESSLQRLTTLLRERGIEFNRTIYLLSDEPYHKITYNDYKTPNVFSIYDESIIANSYSKDLSIPGERIGYLAVNPRAAYRKELLDAMTFANRILGFVNAPALMQRVVAHLQGFSVDIATYARKRELICNGLTECGYEFVEPKGTFYVFPKTPVPDDVEYVKALQEELIIVVPGSGFGGPGHFRIAYCVEEETIINAIPGFKRVMERFKL
ncbi:pyridoxal phosphate-dependent aminotransferase [candidate division CSSED10-310 bacterium]|uniref:Aminotransferase n=1 Tax=candidate division CSSED10-310 bacterium TaxID=2855610 RepID=A0ABV6YT13_UNCC1